MAAIPADELLLPAPAQLELADYLMGSYLSELEEIRSRMKRELGPSMTIEEYRQFIAAGVEFTGPEHDRSDLYRLLEFLGDALVDAERIREIAQAAMESVLAELRELREREDSAARRAYETRIAEYHRDQVRRWRRRRDG